MSTRKVHGGAGGVYVGRIFIGIKELQGIVNHNRASRVRRSIFQSSSFRYLEASYAVHADCSRVAHSSTSPRLQPSSGSEPYPT